MARRFKNFAWDKALDHHRAMLLRMGRWQVPPPDALINMNVQLFLEAYHRGPWKMIAALMKHQLHSVWLHHGWLKWEWIRTRIFRRPQNETLAIAQRTWDEMDAVEEMSSEL